MNTVRLCRTAGKALHAVLVDFDAVGPEEADTRMSLATMNDPVSVLPGGLGHRKAYKRAVIPGLGVQEYEPNGQAADEVERLYEDVCGLLYSQRVSMQDSKRVSTA